MKGNNLQHVLFLDVKVSFFFIQLECKLGNFEYLEQLHIDPVVMAPGI
jgi:hypothetical protein